MISEEKMREVEGKNIKLVANNDKIFEGKVYSYEQAEDDGDEPMLLIGNHWAISQAEIKSIGVIDYDK